MRMRSIFAIAALGALLPSLALGYTGVFRSSFTQTTGSNNPTGIVAGDYDMDGAVDVAMPLAGQSGNELFLFPGIKVCVGGDQNGFRCAGDGECTGGTCESNGQLTFPNSIPLNSFPSTVLQAKIDDDNLDDLIVARGNDNTVVFLKGLGTAEFFAEPANPTTVGQSPVGLATTDFDADGNVDLIVANEGSDSAPGSVSVLKGAGDGTFVLVLQPNPSDPEEPLRGAPTDLGTRGIAVGNLDSDPEPEILAANRRRDNISVFSSDATGVLTAQGTLSTGLEPSDIALADVNGDTKLDLIVATTNGDAVTVQFGNGDRTFGTAQTYPVGTAPTRLALGDLNGDGRIDIAASNTRSGDVSVLLATTPGVYAPARTFVADAEPQAVTLADMNHDDVLDVLVAAQGKESAAVAVLNNLGDGALHAVEDVRAANGPTSLAVADLDGDGGADLLVSGDSGQLAIFPSKGSGFAPPDLLNIGGRTLGVVAADLNGDAQPDIIVADSLNNTLAVSISTGAGHFATPVTYPTAPGPAGVAVGDFNGDGRPDLAASTVGADRVCQGGENAGETCVDQNDCPGGGVCAGQGKTSVLLQQANGTFGPRRDTDVEETPIGIVAINANCDGRDDLLVANLASSTVVVLRSNPDGTSFATAQTIGSNDVGTSPITLAVADFDRDGTDDFAVANTVAPFGQFNVHLFKGNCAGPYAQFPQSAIRVGEFANSLVARDFTGDGRVDLGVISQTSNDLCLLVGNGNGTLGRIGFGSCDGVSRMPIWAAAGDFDADGRYDAASANNDPSANNVSVLFNCARDEGCDPNPPPTPLPGEAALRGDGNDDGRRSAADLVAVGAEVMDDDGFRVEDTTIKAPNSVAGVDANGDGRVDAQDRLAVAHKIFGGG